MPKYKSHTNWYFKDYLCIYQCIPPLPTSGSGGPLVRDLTEKNWVVAHLCCVLRSLSAVKLKISSQLEIFCVVSSQATTSV